MIKKWLKLKKNNTKTIKNNNNKSPGKLKDKDKFNVIGGLLGDKDKRTHKSIWWGVFNIICAISLVLGIIFYVRGMMGMNYEIMNNTTPIGTNLEFSKSRAKVIVKDVWTDKNKDVLVVKLGYPGASRDVLPVDGAEYNITLITNDGKKPKIEGKYGILGTEGDAYLFLKGDIEEKAYQIVIANTLQLSTGKGSGNLDKSTKVNDDSLEKALAETSFGETDDNGIMFQSSGSKKKPPKFDNVNFRVNAYTDTTHIYNGSFLNSDGDIDYGKVVSQTSIEGVVNHINNQIKKSEENLKTYKQSQKQYEKRVKKNKKDADAKKNVEDVKDSINEEEKNLKKLKETKRIYEEADFDKSSFGNMQEKLKFQNL